MENQKTEQPNVQRDYSSSEGVLTLHFDGKLNEKYTGFTAIITAYTSELPKKLFILLNFYIIPIVKMNLI